MQSGRRRSARAEAGLESLLKYQPTHASVEDNMREAVHMLELLQNDERRGFLRLFGQFVQQRHKPAVEWARLEPPPPACVVQAKDIPPCPEDQALRHELLDKMVILKLNGGLGTSMGCTWPKSAIEVRNDWSFLDLTVRQVEYLNSMYGVDVPLVLLDSFKTHETTAKIIRKYRMHNLSIHTFMQSCHPRIIKDTLQPMPSRPFGESSPAEWYPPGHGDVYNSLFTSGLLENLINQGKEYIFISNVDNLGATVDLDMLYHIFDQEVAFAVEAIERTRADVSGGLIAGYQGKPKLVELSSVPADKTDKVMKNFNLFNSNNIWVNLRSLQRLVAKDEMTPDVTVKERQVNGIKTLQLETLGASAIECFDKALAIVVDRGRYLPVKSTSDLFLVQSNLYVVRHGRLVMSEERVDRSTPLIKLGREFTSVQDYLRRIPHGVPNITHLDHLTVAGDVIFGENVTLKGTVIIVANEGSVIMIPSGTVLRDSVVTGNLRILDH